MSFSSYADPDIEVLLSKVNKGLYNIKLTDVTIANLQVLTEPTLTSNLLFKDKAIESIEIVDSAAEVQEYLDLLNGAGSRIKSIDLGYNSVAGVPVIAPLTPGVILREESSKIRPDPNLKMIEPAQRSVTAKTLSCESIATPIGAGTLSAKDEVTLCGLTLRILSFPASATIKFPFESIAKPLGILNKAEEESPSAAPNFP